MIANRGTTLRDYPKVDRNVDADAHCHGLPDQHTYGKDPEKWLTKSNTEAGLTQVIEKRKELRASSTCDFS